MLGFWGICLLMAVPGLMEAATAASARYCPNGYYAYREDEMQAKPMCLNAADFFQKQADLQNKTMSFDVYQQESLKFAQTDVQYAVSARKLGLNVVLPQTPDIPPIQECSGQACKDNYKWNANACACTCITLSCPTFQKWNAGTCQCEGSEPSSSSSGSSSGNVGTGGGCIAPAVVGITDHGRCWCPSAEPYALEEGDSSCKSKTGKNAGVCKMLGQAAVAADGTVLCKCTGAINDRLVELSQKSGKTVQYCNAKISVGSSSSGANNCAATAEKKKMCESLGRKYEESLCGCAVYMPSATHN
jgi:hypothetical protein